MVPWWLPVDLPNILANTDCFETWLVLIKRSFQGLSVAIKTVRIVEELVEIWPNEVCDRKTRKKLEKIERQMAREEENDGNDQERRKN